MKNKSTILISFLSLLFLLSACHSNNNSTFNQPRTIADSMNDELLSLHEKAMDKIGTLRTLKDSLTKKIDSTSDDLKNENLKQAIEKLNNADTTMFAWMQKESSDTLTRAGEEKITHLKAQLQQVLAINAQMDSAIIEARTQ